MWAVEEKIETGMNASVRIKLLQLIQPKESVISTWTA